MKVCDHLCGVSPHQAYQLHGIKYNDNEFEAGSN